MNTRRITSLVGLFVLSGCDPAYVQRFSVKPAALGTHARTEVVRLTDADATICLRVVARVAHQYQFTQQKPLAGSDEARGLAYYTRRNEPNHTWIHVSVFRSSSELELRIGEGYTFRPSELMLDFTEAVVTALKAHFGESSVQKKS